MFELIDPLTANQILGRRGWHQNPSTLPLKSNKFIIYSKALLGMLSCNFIGWRLYSGVIKLGRGTWFCGLWALLWARPRTLSNSMWSGCRMTIISNNMCSSSCNMKSFRLINAILGPSDHRMSIESSRDMWINCGNGSMNLWTNYRNRSRYRVRWWVRWDRYRTW